MKARTVLLVTAIAALGTSCQKAAEPSQGPLWFSIDKDGTTSYLLGTIHRGVDPDEWLPKSVWAKLDGARSFAMETDLSDPAVRAMTIRDRGTLHDDLGDAYWAKLESALGPGVAHRIDHTTPIVAVSSLSLLNLPDTPEMDAVLFDRAEREHKSIVFLEPASSEVKVLVKWMTVRTLKEMLDDLADGKKDSDDMLAAYRRGDGDAMLSIADRERTEATKHGHTEAEYRDQMKDLLYDRNASWIAPIENMHASGGGFIAVGALHLLGPNSLVELLRAKGYTVTRL
jgi:uncharacterized protein YbaP (TraB family)